MKVAVVGSRTYPRLSEVRHFVRAMIAKHPTVIVVSGGADGVDREAERAAIDFARPVISLRPTRKPEPMERFPGDIGVYYFIDCYEWDERGTLDITRLPEPYASFRDAAYARNTFVVRESERVVAFHHLNSPGTRNTLQEAKRLKRPAHVYKYSPDGPTAATLIAQPC